MFITSTATRQTLYLALVRSHYGYGSPIWAPQTIELISMLERTQRRATKYILNLAFLTNIDYNTRLQSLHLLPISYWLEHLDMTLVAQRRLDQWVGQLLAMHYGKFARALPIGFIHALTSAIMNMEVFERREPVCNSRRK